MRQDILELFAETQLMSREAQVSEAPTGSLPGRILPRGYTELDKLREVHAQLCEVMRK